MTAPCVLLRKRQISGALPELRACPTSACSVIQSSLRVCSRGSRNSLLAADISNNLMRREPHRSSFYRGSLKCKSFCNKQSREGFLLGRALALPALCHRRRLATASIAAYWEGKHLEHHTLPSRGQPRHQVEVQRDQGCSCLSLQTHCTHLVVPEHLEGRMVPKEKAFRRGLSTAHPTRSWVQTPGTCGCFQLLSALLGKVRWVLRAPGSPRQEPPSC